MVSQTQPKATVQRIKELIEEYADCREELDLDKIAVEIYDLSREDRDIAENMKAYWIESASGAEK